ncbi:hypothetical protein [Paractinoplanes globisporus]|jgi:FtsH ternary system-associated peptide|uniref:FtsH ternary system domain-containing protein n=1 Tax=Paractinoplanes globisporus TaxID=113565 RepID=A0ABW6WBU5_9ACTN|nr:hypothetical protein [Actinoplanes globisporus]
MRVRVQFRFRTGTGEVEFFQVDDVDTGPRQPHHDQRHDEAAADVARVIERNARIDEVDPGVTTTTYTTIVPDEQAPTSTREDPQRDG